MGKKSSNKNRKTGGRIGPGAERYRPALEAGERLIRDFQPSSGELKPLARQMESLLEKSGGPRRKPKKYFAPPPHPPAVLRKGRMDLAEYWSYKMLYYKTVQNSVPDPDLHPDLAGITFDNIAVDPWLNPGELLLFYGTGFGTAPGSAWLNPAAGPSIQLDLVYWGETVVVAQVPDPVTNTRPNAQSFLWLQTANGLMTNLIYNPFRPSYDVYLLNFKDDIGPNLFGDKKDGVAFPGVALQDPDASLFYLARTHTGDGWSQLQAPYASATQLNQGYHLGVGSGQKAVITIGYQIQIPSGFPMEFDDPNITPELLGTGYEYSPMLPWSL